MNNSDDFNKTHSAAGDDAARQRHDEAWKRKELEREPESDGRTDDDVRPPEFSDDAIALKFADRHAGNLRYVAQWSKWMSWDGVRWRVDTTLKAFDRVRRVCREVAVTCNKAKLRKELA